MTQLCHRGIDWSALLQTSRVGDFRIRGFSNSEQYQDEGCVPDNIRIMLLLCREVAMNEKLIVQMDGKRTRIFNTKVDNLACIHRLVQPFFFSIEKYLFFYCFL